ncbi:hypothetical protein F6V30_09745 [Oryzomonas sagensis]|uniref:Uncharacterized protein n=1 Tax=Oryzomonas sagensis TaxID=2603857 RepID=A0ABQ6TP38_9BACT|nr:hypothetical protein [Oryzomonas sagensis]KAB0670422.1 hypothetical protein F6V30_09745 [Oryzomonas sagensis]
MNVLIVYMMFWTGLVSFAATALGQGNAYLRYGHYVLLLMSSAYCLYLLLQRKMIITALSLLIAAYIALRILAVSSFALSHEYTLPGYLYPLRNWVLLLNFFVIGQSTVLPRETVNRLIVRMLIITVLVLFAFEVSGFFSTHFKPLFPLPSRIPFVTYRIGIDEFIIVYAYLLLSLKLIRNELPVPKYLMGTVLILFAFFICQTKQILPAIIIVSLFLIGTRCEPYLTRRKVVFTVSFLAVAGAIVSGLYWVMTNVPHDTYLSLWRRSLALHYVWEKVNAYPIFGYPIPSNLFGGTIPKDIIHHFYGFDFYATIFPSDIPLMFVLAEEGIVGVSFVAALLYLCYRKAPDKASYLIIVLLSLVGTFRMYYLVPVGSSFTFFMLGLITKDTTEG